MYLTRENRSPKWNDDYVERTKELCVLGATEKVLAVAFGVSMGTINKWLNTRPEFARAVEEGMLDINKKVAFSFLQMALGYYYTEEEAKVVRGDVKIVKVEKYCKPDPWSARIFLAIHYPELWAEASKKNEVNNINNTTINIQQLDMDVLSTEELNLMESISGKQKKLMQDGDNIEYR